jgi:hypothetical protein
MLGIRAIKTSPYHVQTEGLVVRLNGTLFHLFKKYFMDNPEQWDWYIPFILFVYRKTVKSSLVFSRFELLYGRQPRRPLDILKEQWEAAPMDLRQN